MMIFIVIPIESGTIFVICLVIKWMTSFSKYLQILSVFNVLTFSVHYFSATFLVVCRADLWFILSNFKGSCNFCVLSISGIYRSVNLNMYPLQADFRLRKPINALFLSLYYLRTARSLERFFSCLFSNKILR